MEMQYALAACVAALLLRRGCDRLARYRRAKLLQELDWVSDRVNRESLLDE